LDFFFSFLFSFPFFNLFSLICFLYFYDVLLYYFSPLLGICVLSFILFSEYLSNIFTVYCMFILFAFPVTLSLLFYLPISQSSILFFYIVVVYRDLNFYFDFDPVFFLPITSFLNSFLRLSVRMTRLHG